MKILIDIPTDQYNEIVYVNYERLRDIVRDGVVIEKCEDAISREQAIKQCGFGMTNLLIADCLRSLPPVTPRTNLAETSQDCISRKAVKEMLTEEWTKYVPMELDMNLSFVLEKISALPSVTPLEAQPTDKCKGCYYNDGETHAECVVCDKAPQPTEPRPITAEGAYVLDIETGDVMTNGEYERRHAQPQIKKGKWIDGYCSECGESCLCDGWGIDIESKFCPECGAKMEDAK